MQALYTWRSHPTHTHTRVGIRRRLRRMQTWHVGVSGRNALSFLASGLGDWRVASVNLASSARETSSVPSLAIPFQTGYMSLNATHPGVLPPKRTRDCTFKSVRVPPSVPRMRNVMYISPRTCCALKPACDAAN